MSHPFYGTAQWKRARLACLQRAGFRCEHCGVSVARRGASRVDHIKTRAQYPDLALEPANLRALCVNCDAKRHAEKADHLNRRRSGADAAGNPIDPEHHWNRRGGQVLPNP